MAKSEAEPRTRPELITTLENTRSSLERADEMENPIERTFRIEQL